MLLKANVVLRRLFFESFLILSDLGMHNGGWKNLVGYIEAPNLDLIQEFTCCER